MDNLDDYVQQQYSNPVQYLVRAGCKDIRASLATHKESLAEEGYNKIRGAQQLGNADLSPLLELGYDEMRTSSSILEYRGHTILKRAREMGAVLDEERIKNNAYRSIINEGAKGLEAVEHILEFSLDPAPILERSYQVLQEYCPDGSFSPRALQAIAYAVQKGATVDRTRLPDKHKLGETIQEILEQNKKEMALQYLRNFADWGIVDVVSLESIRMLESVIRIEQKI